MGDRMELRGVGDDGLTDDERTLAGYRWLAGQGSSSLEICECDVCHRLRGEGTLTDRLMAMQGGAMALEKARHRRERVVARHAQEQWWQGGQPYRLGVVFVAVCCVLLAVILAVQG